VFIVVLLVLSLVVVIVFNICYYVVPIF